LFFAPRFDSVSTKLHFPLGSIPARAGVDDEFPAVGKNVVAGTRLFHNAVNQLHTFFAQTFTPVVWLASQQHQADAQQQEPSGHGGWASACVAQG
jgi:hypothetical protein